MKSALAVGFSAAVLAGLLSAVPGLPAEGFGGKDGRRFTVDNQPPMHGRIAMGTPLTPRPFNPHAYAPQPFRGVGRHDGFPRHGHGGGAWGPIGYYSPGYLVDSDPAYIDPPTYYVPTPVYSSPGPSLVVPPAPPAPPTPRVIEHPNGRYELRGDGVAVPYIWVWVPNPPAAPPPPPAVAEPAPKAAPRPSALYTWTDRDGVVHWTDNINSAPEEYRAKVQKRSL